MPEDAKKFAPHPDDDDSQLRLALAHAVSQLRQRVNTIRSQLQYEYGTVALNDFAEYFRDISSTYKRYAQLRSASHYYIVHKSKRRLRDVNQVCRTAQKIGEFFANYARKPKAYKRITAQLAIDELLNALDNLFESCK
jgi:hypothetical protein